MKDETEEGGLGFLLMEANMPKEKVEMMKRMKRRRKGRSLIGREEWWWL